MDNCLIYKISLVSDQDADYRIPGLDISFLHLNTYFLTGVLILEDRQFKDKLIKNTLIGITDIKYYIEWIRGILNKHVCKYLLLKVSIQLLNLVGF